MDKRIKIILIVLGILIVSIILFASLSAHLTTGNSVSDLKVNHTWTKAVCDSDNYCQDYVISCKNSSFVSMAPITGAAVQFSEDWEDNRNEEDRKRLC